MLSLLLLLLILLLVDVYVDTVIVGRLNFLHRVAHCLEWSCWGRYYMLRLMLLRFPDVWLNGRRRPLGGLESFLGLICSYSRQLLFLCGKAISCRLSSSRICIVRTLRSLIFVLSFFVTFELNLRILQDLIQILLIFDRVIIVLNVWAFLYWAFCDRLIQKCRRW